MKAMTTEEIDEYRFIVPLNRKWIFERGLSKDEVKKIERLHGDIEVLFLRAKANLEDSNILKVLATELQGIEFNLQKLWKFPQDVKYHSYWFKMPGCRCPSLDNMDLMGTDQRWSNGGCPIHDGEDGFDPKVSHHV